jgi:hypothetical protein
VQAALDLSGRAHAKAVGVVQHAEQGLGVVGGVAVPVVTVGPVEGRRVELVDHITNEPGEVAFGEPAAQVGWEQEGLVAVAATEVVGHSQFYQLALLDQKVLIITKVRLLCAVKGSWCWGSLGLSLCTTRRRQPALCQTA